MTIEVWQPREGGQGGMKWGGAALHHVWLVMLFPYFTVGLLLGFIEIFFKINVKVWQSRGLWGRSYRLLALVIVCLHV